MKNTRVMKTLRMRAHRRSTLFIVALAAMAGTALAQPKAKKPKTPAKGAAPAKTPAPTPAKGSGDDAGDIEMNPDDKQGAGSGSAAGTGQGKTDAPPGEIDMSEPEQQQGDLNADLNASNQANAVKAPPVKKTPLSWQDIVVVI